MASPKCWAVYSPRLKEQYPVTGCHEIKRCEEGKRTFKNPYGSCLAEFNTTLKLLRIYTDQWYNVPVKFWLGPNLNFLALLLLPLARGQKDRKRFDADCFHTNSDNCERNSNNKDCKKETIETLMWTRRSCGIKLREVECFAMMH